MSPLRERLSLEAASTPLSAIIANKKEKEKTKIETRFFLTDLTIPLRAQLGAIFSVINNEKSNTLKG